MDFPNGAPSPPSFSRRWSPEHDRPPQGECNRYRRRPHQRPHPRSPSPPDRCRRFPARCEAASRSAEHRSGVRARSGRGRRQGRPAGLQDHGLRQVQVRARPAAQGIAAESDERHHQRDEVPAQDRRPRLRDQDEARRALLGRRVEGQAHDHVPGSRDGAPGARAAHPREGRGSGRRSRERRGGTPPGRPEHDDGAEPDPAPEGQRPGRGEGCEQGRRPDRHDGGDRTRRRRRHRRRAPPRAHLHRQPNRHPRPHRPKPRPERHLAPAAQPTTPNGNPPRWAR